MILSVNNLKDKWHRYFCNQILLLRHPTEDFLHNSFCLPTDSSSSPMNLDLSFTEGFLLWILHSLLHIFHFSPFATFSLIGDILKKKRKKKRKKKKAPFDPTSSSGYHFIFCSCWEQNFLKRVYWSLSHIPQQHTHFFLEDAIFINFLAFKET